MLSIGDGAGQQNTQLLYGDFELSMRAPYMLAPAGSPLSCDPGVYAYFTAGYVNKDGKWNEMNFGFHPVSLERTVSLSLCVCVCACVCVCVRACV